jgi:acetoacetate decarboxylase
MSEVKGFFYPRTAEGRASIVPPPPWYYSGDLLTVEYRTDPARVAELLPAPLEPAAEDPGAVAMIWADWQSCSTGCEELLDPVRAQYGEAFVVVRCSYQGRTYSRCVYIWVDKDFAIGRGLHQGYPKKLGSIHQTRPHPYGLAPRIAAGETFGATLAANDRRLAEAVLTLREVSPTNGFVNGHPMAHHRVLPGIGSGALDAHAELIESTASDFEAGPAWSGDAELRLFDSPTEELSRLSVDEIIGGYYRQVAMTWNGGRTLADLTPLAAQRVDGAGRIAEAQPPADGATSNAETVLTPGAEAVDLDEGIR